MNILVVGGAGYIGSHCVKLLSAIDGYNPVVLDNLVYGHREAVADDIPFYEDDLGNVEIVQEILISEKIQLVMHFAAFAYVGESVTSPLKYYSNNLAKTVFLLEAMQRAEVKKFIFSSTCATYGIPDSLPITEEHTQKPINPYGQTKLDVENLLKSLAHSNDIQSAVFRYFNAAGAAADGSIGEDHDPETHLIPLVFEVASGQRDILKIFGDDYATPDGTCLRDYLHVDDIAKAHIAVISRFKDGTNYMDYNLGTGQPTSVLEVVKAVEKITGNIVRYEIEKRREGDPPELYSDRKKASNELNWDPQYTDIESIISSAWNWHKNNPNGYKSI